jgi:hypothetical protein
MSWAADAYLTKSSDLTKLKTVIRNLLVNEGTRESEKLKDVSMKEEALK